jgi:hypothetical protein
MATTITKRTNGGNGDGSMAATTTTTAPQTTAVSNCSWGGNGEQWGWRTVRGKTMTKPPVTDGNEHEGERARQGTNMKGNDHNR